MSEMRVCRICHKEKLIDEFRLIRPSKKGSYRTAQCLVCEREKSRIRSRERRKDPAFVALEKERSHSRIKKWGAILAEKYRTDPKHRERVLKASKLRLKRLSDSDRENYLLIRKKGYEQMVKNVPLWYANRLLGGTKTHRYPLQMLLLKQTHKRIDNFLKGKHEEHN